MTAYNYSTQEWATGRAGDRVRLEQLYEELAIIEGPRGREYLTFTGSTETTETVASRIRAEMHEPLQEIMWEEHYCRQTILDDWFKSLPMKSKEAAYKSLTSEESEK